MTEITTQKYRKEIESIVEGVIQDLISEGESSDLDSLTENYQERIHETVDGHQWVIYYCYNMPVLGASNQPLGLGIANGVIDANATIIEIGILNLHTQMAYCAILEDCNEYFYKIEDDIEFSTEED